MIEIEIKDDFDLRKIADSGQCFRWQPIENNGYRIIHGGSCLCIWKVEDTDNADEEACSTDNSEMAHLKPLLRKRSVYTEWIVRKKIMRMYGVSILIWMRITQVYAAR